MVYVSANEKAVSFNVHRYIGGVRPGRWVPGQQQRGRGRRRRRGGWRERRSLHGRALHVVYSTSHTYSSSDWLEHVSANDNSA
jgi:hypothetical protein